jgi:hypothetical protein
VSAFVSVIIPILGKETQEEMALWVQLLFVHIFYFNYFSINYTGGLLISLCHTLNIFCKNINKCTA